MPDGWPIDPQAGYRFDDTRRYAGALGLSAEGQARVYELNARRVYPRPGTAG